MTLKIGPLEVDPPVVLAPMAGVTNAPFRALCRSFGAGLFVSEMVTARALVERNDKTMKMVRRAATDDVHSVQLYGVDPTTMSLAVRRLVDEIGVDHIDMNFGCPVPKVTRKGGGAALPVHHVLFRRVVAAAVDAAGTVPVTVKMRIGVNDAWRTFVDAGRAAEDAGAAAVALHARTAEQAYSGAADWNAIGELKEAVTSVPVLGNGDVWEAEDARRMMRETDCVGVVVGRGCLGRPWLFGELAAAFSGGAVSAPTPPSLGEVCEIMRGHARLLCEAAGGESNGIRDFRKHTSWYVTGFPVGGEMRRRLSMISSLDELDALLDRLDPSVPFPPGAGRMPRGHTHGPRPVALPDRWLETIDDPTPPAGAELLVSGG
jgi:nifR3 family TIM-barrel protein